MQEGILDYAYAVPHVGLPPHAGRGFWTTRQHRHNTLNYPLFTSLRVHFLM